MAKILENYVWISAPAKFLSIGDLMKTLCFYRIFDTNDIFYQYFTFVNGLVYEAPRFVESSSICSVFLTISVCFYVFAVVQVQFHLLRKKVDVGCKISKKLLQVVMAALQADQ